MYTIKGKYNSANIMLPEGQFADDVTTKQIYSFLNHPAFQDTYIVLMPDLHAGAGSCIGFTMKLNDYVIPNIVGVDIGCGVLTGKLPKNSSINLSSLDEFIRGNIPSGFNVNDKPMSDRSILKVPVQAISDKINSNIARNLRAIGTLGGGNHFIELGIDSNNNQWLTVHTGSRKFGLDIANYHQKRAKKYIKDNFITGIQTGLEFMYKDSEYFDDMNVAQLFARENRSKIMSLLTTYLGVELSERIESVHNYIDFDTNIIRKGAISAQLNENVVIPFNMVDGLVIGKGNGNKKWNYSAPHGAGRILSRTKAKKELDLAYALKEMQDANIFTTSLNQNTLDEARGAYKDKDMILNAIEETIEVIDFIKPIYNFKAG